jgi:hypothetical protein
MERQREDWRNLRLLDESVQPYRVAVNRLATRLLDMTQDGLGSQQESNSTPPTFDGIQQTRADPLEKSSSTPETLDEEDVGVIDLLAEGEEAFPRVIQTLKLIGPEIESVGDLSKVAAQEIKESDAAGKGFRGRLLVMNRLAQKLDVPAGELETLTSKYAADLLILNPAVKQLIQLLSEGPQEDPEAVEDFFEVVRTMVGSSGEAAESIKGLIRVMEGNERFSRELRVPLKRMRVALQSMVDGQQLIESWRDAIDELE